MKILPLVMGVSAACVSAAAPLSSSSSVPELPELPASLPVLEEETVAPAKPASHPLSSAVPSKPAQLPAASSVAPLLSPAPAPLAAAKEPSRFKVAVLRYGDVGSKEGRGIDASTFRRQMKYLSQAGIKVIALQELENWMQGKMDLSTNSVLICFDEASSRVKKEFLPVMRELRYPCVIFADGNNLSNRPSRMSVSDLKEARLQGAAIGSCSLHRPSSARWQFAALSGAEAAKQMEEEELGVSQRDIAAKFGACDAFAYPEGLESVLLPGSLSAYHYKLAFCEAPAKLDRRCPAYMINSYPIDDAYCFARAVNFSKDEDWSTVFRNVASAMTEEAPVAPASRDALAVESSAMEDDDFAEEVEDAEDPSESVADASSAHAVLDATEGTQEIPATEPRESPSASEGAESPAVEAPLPESPTVDATAPQTADVEKPAADAQASAAEGQGAVLAGNPRIVQNAQGEWVSRDFAQPTVGREKTRVAVLGYHNFSNSKPITEMRMRTSEFCQQMQYLRDAGLTVITMQDFLDWRFGTRCLPERCVLITIDDGWKSVYTDAFPVLRAYGYPFTCFLYTQYINVKGDSMSFEMLKEMRDNGCTIGSHSANHLYPRFWRRYAESSPAYSAQVQREIVDSGAKLKQLFGHCSTYCYPGGFVTRPMENAMAGAGYAAAFTVLPAKVGCSESAYQVHRYMVFGVDPSIFRQAVNFGGQENSSAVREGIAAAQERARAFFPKAFENVSAAVVPKPAARSAVAPQKHTKAASAAKAKPAGKGAKSLPSAKPQPRATVPAPQPSKSVAPPLTPLPAPVP